jgi:hypothetical protein
MLINIIYVFTLSLQAIIQYPTYVKLKDIAPVIGFNGEEECKMLKFSAYYGTAEFTKDQSD